jgi:hypothetical protein
MPRRVAIVVWFSPAQAAADPIWLRRLRNIAPIPKKPVSIIAQAAGSGTPPRRLPVLTVAAIVPTLSPLFSSQAKRSSVPVPHAVPEKCVQKPEDAADLPDQRSLGCSQPRLRPEREGRANLGPNRLTTVVGGLSNGTGKPIELAAVS